MKKGRGRKEDSTDGRPVYLCGTLLGCDNTTLLNTIVSIKM